MMIFILIISQYIKWCFNPSSLHAPSLSNTNNPSVFLFLKTKYLSAYVLLWFQKVTELNTGSVCYTYSRSSIFIFYILSLPNHPTLSTLNYWVSGRISSLLTNTLLGMYILAWIKYNLHGKLKILLRLRLHLQLGNYLILIRLKELKVIKIWIF